MLLVMKLRQTIRRHRRRPADQGTAIVGENHDGDIVGDIPNEGDQSARDIQGESDVR
jgi:hypothetical protein